MPESKPLTITLTDAERQGLENLAFIEDYNRTMAKPFKWTCQGKALPA
jgi:hypothetical protein